MRNESHFAMMKLWDNQTKMSSILSSYIFEINNVDNHLTTNNVCIGKISIGFVCSEIKLKPCFRCMALYWMENKRVSLIIKSIEYIRSNQCKREKREKEIAKSEMKLAQNNKIWENDETILVWLHILILILMMKSLIGGGDWFPCVK